MRKILKILTLAIALCSLDVIAASLNITAAFSPDINDPTKQEFMNTTPITGYCEKWPQNCVQSVRSVLTTLYAKQQYQIDALGAERDTAYFGFPSGYRTVDVFNTDTNEKHTLKFRLAGFSSEAENVGNENWSDSKGNSRTWGLYPPAPCKTSGGPAISSGRYIHYAWYISDKKDISCVMYSKIVRDVTISFNKISYAYELVTPNPLKMNGGVYKGTMRLEVGHYKDIDFGDNFTANDDFLDINFTLTVNHELKVSPQAGAGEVILSPCYHGTSCTKEEAETNWERWIVTNIPPQKMSGISRFTLSSSGSFTVYMNCGSGAALSPESCPLHSAKSGTVVPVKALITLPDNVIDNTGSNIINRPLKTERNQSEDVFVSNSFGVNRPGQVDFVIAKKDISEMLKSRPDSWSGSVTLIFDPNLY